MGRAECRVCQSAARRPRRKSLSHSAGWKDGAGILYNERGGCRKWKWARKSVEPSQERSNGDVLDGIERGGTRVSHRVSAGDAG